MTHTSQTSRRAAGVTLMEMMVALAITTFVILVVNQLFNQVVDTVGRGTQAGEILQRARAFNEQIATETETRVSPTYNPDLAPPHERYAQWWSRMVGPAGREGNGPGGFLVVVQRIVAAPVTIDDQVEGIRRGAATAPAPYNNQNFAIRSDQLMFIYDQMPLLDQSGTKRLPPLAPATLQTFGSDMNNSLNADYVRMWYGHVAQVPQDPTVPFDVQNHDLGVPNSNNPNALAQDWVLGRHALFLTGLDAPNNIPSGIRAMNTILISANISLSGAPRLWSGLTDISDQTLDDVLSHPTFGLNRVPTNTAYQAQALNMAFTAVPLLTSAKPTGNTNVMQSQDVARSHTYFMGGVSDFIVEFAGDLVIGEFDSISNPPAQVGPDGELDRDTAGRIKWYSYFAPGPNDPVTYFPPPAANYDARMDGPLVDTLFKANFPTRGSYYGDTAQAAYVWQHKWNTDVSPKVQTPNFTKWPWMLRIRYRLHDRRGDFEGRQITINTATGETEPEPGAWFETIIPVNHQGVQ